MPPGLLLHVGQRMNQKVFFSSPSNEDFSQNSSCCQGKGGRFYLFPQFILGLLELPFSPNFPLMVGVSLSLPSSEALLPQNQAASQEGVTTLPELLLALFLKVSQQIVFLLGKEAW